MDLYVLRHGKAEPFLPPEGTDTDRALTRQGRDEIRQIAAWMLRWGCRFDLIATSPFRRSIETAEIVTETYGLRKNLLIWKELSPGMDFDLLMDQICYLTLNVRCQQLHNAFAVTRCQPKHRE